MYRRSTVLLCWPNCSNEEANKILIVFLFFGCKFAVSRWFDDNAGGRNSCWCLWCCASRCNSIPPHPSATSCYCDDVYHHYSYHHDNTYLLRLNIKKQSNVQHAGHRQLSLNEPRSRRQCLFGQLTRRWVRLRRESERHTCQGAHSDLHRVNRRGQEKRLHF